MMIFDGAVVSSVPYNTRVLGLNPLGSFACCPCVYVGSFQLLWPTPPQVTDVPLE